MKHAELGVAARSITTWNNRRADIRRAFSDFLAVPTATVAAFLLLAFGTYMLDRKVVTSLEPLRAFLRMHLVVDPTATTALLGVIAGGLITITSITFSLLLLAVQQSAAALTSQVLDQFLRRRLNQLYFGVFVGVSLYALVILATTNTNVTPVFGATCALVLTLIALMVLVLLLYTTLNQMRPNRIIEAIHDLTLRARERELALLSRTRREPVLRGAAVKVVVRSEHNGYVASLGLDRIGRAAKTVSGEAEVVLLVSMGTFVCFHDPIAEVSAPNEAEAHAIATAVRLAVDLQRQRDFHVDSGFGVMQLANIGWTSISSSKSNPAPGLAAIRELRDLLSRWSEETIPECAPPSKAVPVVYRDSALEGVIGALESLAVAASESIQHQSCAEVVRSLAIIFPRLPAALKPRAEETVMSIISGLGDHVLTMDLRDALDRLIDSLTSNGRPDSAAALCRARAELAESLGVLNSRGTRVAHGS